MLAQRRGGGDVKVALQPGDGEAGPAEDRQARLCRYLGGSLCRYLGGSLCRYLGGSPGGIDGGHQVASAWLASRPPSDSQTDSSGSVPAGWAGLVRAARMSGTRMRLTARAARSMAPAASAPAVPGGTTSRSTWLS